MARLINALFMVHSEDLAAVEAALRLLGKTPEEIQEKKKTYWAYFLLRCRRYDSLDALFRCLNVVSFSKVEQVC